jgi:hypothetical protein
MGVPCASKLMRQARVVGPNDVTIDNVDPPEGATHHNRCGDSCVMWARRVKKIKILEFAKEKHKGSTLQLAKSRVARGASTYP